MSDAKPRLRRYRRAGDLRPDGALAWVAEIRAALDEGRLAAYSQPILPLAGAEPREELLLRMVTREGDVLPPAAFIPAAEQFGRHVRRRLPRRERTARLLRSAGQPASRPAP